MMKMKNVMKMSSWLLLLGLAVTFAAAAGPAQSCRGRCTESFRRGRLCECDPDCINYNTCCDDYQLHCGLSGNQKSQRSKKRSTSDSEEWFKDAVQMKKSCPQSSGAEGQVASVSDLLQLLTDRSSGPASPAAPTSQLQNGMGNVPASLLPMSVPSSSGGAPHSPARASSLANHGAANLGISSPQSPSGPGAPAGTLNVQLVLSDGGTAPSGPSQGLNSPAGSGPRPSTLQDVAQALGLSLGDAGSDGPETGLSANDLCSGSPINGLTVISNGTILIFKGDLFWAFDPLSGSVGSPQSITDTLGIPGPIDAVFTRCNCQGNTYIIKGDQYWRLDSNLKVEPGFPQSVASGFAGLTGSISAALPLPATRGRPETVYFFKGGDIMQKFTFPAASSCSKKPRASYGSPLARQAEGRLSGEINIKVSLKGFPTPVTSALSMPNPQRSEGYEYYVFSGPLFFSIKISGDLPALTKPHPSAAFTAQPGPTYANMPTNTDSSSHMAKQIANPAHPANSVMRWLKCP